MGKKPLKRAALVHEAFYLPGTSQSPQIDAVNWRLLSMIVSLIEVTLHSVSALSSNRFGTNTAIQVSEPFLCRRVYIDKKRLHWQRHIRTYLGGNRQVRHEPQPSSSAETTSTTRSTCGAWSPPFRKRKELLLV
jgi:hypothetical protein